MATAPVIGARAREVAYAVATITLFGTLAVFLYPTIGRALVGLPQPSFGLWAGVAVHDTSQVIATSAAYGPDALDVATVVKLIRNALMAPLLLLIATGWAARGGETVGTGPAAGSVGRCRCSCSGSWRSRRCGRSGSSTPARRRRSTPWPGRLILVALAAVGMSIHVGELRETSWRPLAVGFTRGARRRARQPRRRS